ncbi:MAG: hypothetical protein FF85_05400 [alpha proteobacterium QL1]|nr:MAG: hypothetical protein FF85_05400 [alpha proteobacterium QL1]
MKKTILVTGGSGVIGSSILELFYKRGFNVIAAGIANKTIIGQQQKKFNSKRSLLLNTDLTGSKNVKKVVGTSIKKFKKIDILVNCAGIQFVMPIENTQKKYGEK